MATASLRLSVLTLVIVLLATVGSPAASAARLRRRPRTPYRIGGADGWRVPPPEDKEYYIKWASPIAFYVSDSIEFTYRNDYTVIKVSKAGYYHCNETVGIVAMPSNGSNFFFLDQPGYFYFTSVELDHCKKGERLMINVLADAEPLAPSSLPSSAAAPGQASSLSPSSAPAPSHSTEYATAAAETPGPSPSTEYATAATGASFAHALAWPVTLTLAWLISFILISVVSMCIYRRLRQRQLRRRHDRLRRSPTLAWLISGCQHVNLATY